MTFNDYQKKLTPGAAELKSALRSSSLTRRFVHLSLFEATAALRRWFASASCLRKAWHFLWCCVRPLGNKAVNRSWQCLHGNMIKLIRNPISRLAVSNMSERGMTHTQVFFHTLSTFPLALWLQKSNSRAMTHRQAPSPHHWPFFACKLTPRRIPGVAQQLVMSIAWGSTTMMFRWRAISTKRR